MGLLPWWCCHVCFFIVPPSFEKLGSMRGPCRMVQFVLEIQVIAISASQSASRTAGVNRDRTENTREMLSVSLAFPRLIHHVNRWLLMNIDAEGGSV